MRTVAIIQARTGSTRLPAKVLKHLAGKTVLEHVIVRVRAAAFVDEVIIATTTSPTDDPIVALAEACGVRWSRGSESDVLSRYFYAAQEAKADVVVRITSDCPLLDPALLDDLIGRFLDAIQEGRGVDYLSNTLERTFPRGLDAEIFSFEALEKAHREAKRPHEREHVTPYVHQQPDLFTLVGVRNEVDLSHHRWTLDTSEDFAFIQAVYKALHREDALFTTQQILKLLDERPALPKINAHIEQKSLGG